MSRKSRIPVVSLTPTKQQAEALERMRAFALERKATKPAHQPPDPVYAVERANGIVSIPLDGEPHRKARIREIDYDRMTRSSSFSLTRTRWYLEDGMVRAMSRKEKPVMTEGLLVAALLCDARDGDMLKIEDPLVLFPETINRFVAV